MQVSDLALDFLATLPVASLLSQGTHQNIVYACMDATKSFPQDAAQIKIETGAARLDHADLSELSAHLSGRVVGHGMSRFIVFRIGTQSLTDCINSV